MLIDFCQFLYDSVEKVLFKADCFFFFCFFFHDRNANRLSAKNDLALLPPPPTPGNFADIVFLKGQSFLHRIRGVCTLLVGA